MRTTELRAPQCDPPVQWTVLEWRLRPGASFSARAPLLDLIGPNGVTTLLAEAAGRLSETLVDSGGVVDSGETMAILILTTPERPSPE